MDIFLSYRNGLSLNEVENWTVTEDDCYWFIVTIEELFEKLYPEIPLNSYLAYPDKRISDNIPFSTIQRMLKELKIKLSK
ncbi:hypothetical protein KKD03_04195 [Patescibacteria group bacterium]|nr:hypothetical protein [Patescibacteria group bacterium]